jgi:Lar family restriction alleviation protein
MNNELKPCPFCGSEAVIRESKAGGGVACWSVFIKCPECRAEIAGVTGLYTDEDFKAKMVAKWNCRTQGAKANEPA